jgi:hypothetical protein
MDTSISELKDNFDERVTALKARQCRADERQEGLLQDLHAQVTELVTSVQMLVQVMRPSTTATTGNAYSQSATTPWNAYSFEENVDEGNQWSRTHDARFPNTKKTPGNAYSQNATTAPATRRPPVREVTALPSDEDVDGGNQRSRAHSARVLGTRPPKFRGKDGENVLSWLHKVEHFFVMHGVEEEMKVPTVSALVYGDADNFYFYLVVRKDGNAPTWKEFRHAYIAKYENATARRDLLRQKLQSIRYRGHSRMNDFCKSFRFIEAQIYDMAFAERFFFFSEPLPEELALYLQDINLRSEDMEVVYQAARQWATRRVASKRLLKFGRPSSSGSCTGSSDKSSDSSSNADTNSNAESESNSDFDSNGKDGSNDDNRRPGSGDVNDRKQRSRENARKPRSRHDEQRAVFDFEAPTGRAIVNGGPPTLR